jgi:hypothetical protein
MMEPTADARDSFIPPPLIKDLELPVSKYKHTFDESLYDPITGRLCLSSYELFSHDLSSYRDGSAHARISKNATVGDLLKRVDKIDKDLVARVNVTDLFASVHASWWCSNAFTPALRLALPDGYRELGHTATSPPKMEDPREIERYRKKKNMTTDKAKTITSLVSAALRSLAVESRLFEIPNDTIDCDVGAFFVEKAGDANKLRVIIDGRFANIQYSASCAKFSFFSLETLRQVIDNLSIHKKWYAINIDLRHWFHQIPLPARYKKIFGLPLTDRNNKRGSFYLWPRAFPMGWTYSPLVAQALTWSFILSRHHSLKAENKHNFPKEADLPLNHLKLCNELFSWIPLNGGGGIFVLLDNILVVTPKKDVADFWFDKIKEDAKRYNIVLKTKPDPANSDLSEDELLERQCRRTLTEGGSETFDFVGVTWSHSEHWAIINRETEDTTAPNVSKDVKNVGDDGIWRGTYRQLASILGRINWHRRIMRHRFFEDPENKIGTKSLLEIYSVMTPKQGETWNSHIALSAELTEGLAKAWAHRNSNTRCPARPLAWDPRTGNMRWFATDAAKDDTNHTAVIVEYNISNWQTRTVYSSTPKSVEVYDYPAEYSIALGELHAIVRAVRSVTEPNTLVCLATDSMNAKHWVESAKAENETARSLLKLLFGHMESRGIRLYLVYVPSADNVADHATRRKPPTDASQPSLFLAAKLEATARLLARSDFECRKAFTLHGGQTGGMPRSLNVDLEHA